MSELPAKPAVKPVCPCFSCGPTAKHPGWSREALRTAITGRSHRSAPAKVRLKEIVDLHRETLEIPADYRIAIVPGSDSGAVETALWSLLGPLGVNALAWENFSKDWMRDITDQLKLKDVKTFDVEYSQIPDLSAVDTDRDTVFVWNGTTSGVCLPGTDWIKDDRKGLTICDATSAVFIYDMPWQKLDVVTWSWQKAIGSEGAHGMLVLSPRAVERIKTYTPPWPMPKLYRLVDDDGQLNEALFAGEIINTPSMLAVEDCKDALLWVKSVGGWRGTAARCRKNAAALDEWVQKTDWLDYACPDLALRSVSSVCLSITDPWFTAQSKVAQKEFIKTMIKTLESEHAAYDAAHYRDAPPGLRLWCGPTVEEADIRAVTPWLDWAFAATKAQSQNQGA